jgi:hypothetical protein
MRPSATSSGFRFIAVASISVLIVIGASASLRAAMIFAR